MARLPYAIQPRILEHALYLFSERGLDGVTIKDVIKACGSPASSVYRLFLSKEKLYEAAIRDVIWRAQGAMGKILLSDAATGGGDPRAQIAEVVRAWYDSMGRADARLLHQVLKQVNAVDKDLRKQAYWSIEQMIAIVFKRVQGRSRHLSSDGLSAELLITTLFECKVLQAAPEPSKAESARVNALIDNWLSLVLPKK